MGASAPNMAGAPRGNAGGMPGAGGRPILAFRAGIWNDNPIAVQILGICSALAITTRLENALVMGAGVVFVVMMSSLILSLLRKAIPRRIRMIAEVAIIATFVILVDQFLRANYWDMSKRLGPYVGLIITNCIIMGRAEAFALHNRPGISVVDAAANGLGYTFILAVIGLVRELGGTGTIVFGERVLLEIPDYPMNLVLRGAPGAFIALGFLVALLYALGLRKEREART